LAESVSSRLAGVHRPAGARISEALLDLAATHGVRDSRGTIINIRLTHADLARWAVTSRETVSAVLARLRRRGFVLVDGKRVVVVDAEALAAVVGSGRLEG